MTEPLPMSRRQVLLSVGAAGAGVVVLTACGGGNNAGARAGASTGADAGSGATSAAPSSGGGGSALAKVSDIPVGGAISAKTADGEAIILAQPSAGQVVGFSAKCTHQGCTVAPDKDKLVCPCHGSVFQAASGKNISGPAPRPLDKVAVKVEGGNVVQA